MTIQLLYIALGVALFTLLYMKNKQVRLDQAGISQGFSVFRTFIRYETIADVHTEVRSYKGASFVGLVVSQQKSARRIVIPLASFDRTELAQFVDALAHEVPQAHFQADLHL